MDARTAASLLPEPLTLVDAGCRWGVPEPWLEAGSGLRIFAFDADAAECARLQPTAPLNVTYVPTALGNRSGPAQLYLTADPACSSLYPPSQTALRRFPELSILESSGHVDVELKTLESWAAEQAVPRIDVLKLDVQGAELDILIGMGALLDGLRIAEIEVAFNPIYENQPLFADVDRYLRNTGLELWRLGHLVHYGTATHPSVSRNDRQFFDSEIIEFPVQGGQLMWGHAYYCARRMIDGDWTDEMDALADGLAASLFGFDELADAAWQAAVTTKPGLEHGP